VSASPPEANYEYSRGPKASEPGSARRLRPPRLSRQASPARSLILAGPLLGAILLLVAEFTTLYTVHVAGRTAAISSEATGSHHAFALVPLALFAAVLSVFVWSRAGSRPTLLAIGALGVLALLIALLGDLPDAHSHGITRGFVLATATPTTGLYLETLGALLLVLTSGLGLVAGTPTRAAPRRREQRYTP
jgi:hypothetical protein